jgi:predicted enzyme related to lactoylglutathione lyase
MTRILEPEIHTQTVSSSTATAEPSRFTWYELHTPDAAAAAAFYGAVLGWTTRDGGVPNRKYTLVCVDQIPIGGLLEKPASGFASGTTARWMGYLGVQDVSVFSERVQQAGGTILRAAEEIPGVGTFAVAADPQGAMFTLFQPPPGVTRPALPPPCTPGMPAWHELGAIDWQPEFQFYSDLFGWTKADAVNMGPNSVYQIFAVGSESIGGMMTLPNPTDGAGWLFYFHVEEIEAAIDRVKHNGGTVLHGPAVVPGGQQIALCLDTQGAIFGMVGPGRQ